jgi:uncharacterized C2H2 Zn-finger protein
LAIAKVDTTLEPKINSKGKMECPLCGRVFHSNTFYERHLEVNHLEQVQRFKAESQSER